MDALCLKLSDHVLWRSMGDECVVVCLRNGSCAVIKHAQPFLENLSNEWQPASRILDRIATKFGVPINVVREDAEMMWRELSLQRFIAIVAADDSAKENVANCKCDPIRQVQQSEGFVEDYSSPVADFYLRHNLPSDLHIDLTDRCNERCVHCYIPKGGGTMLPTEWAMKALHEFRESQGLTVLVTGGECMLHPDFELILREAKRIGLNIIVMSNLTRCDEKMVGLLKEIDPQFVNVSLYSMCADEHDAITQVRGSWDKTVTAIENLQNAGVHVRLATPIMRANRHAVKELQAFANEHHVHDVLDCDIIGKTDHDCSNQKCALTLDEMAKVVRENRGTLAKPPLDVCRCCPDARVCDIGDGHLCLNAKGEYYPCDGFHGMTLGLVKDDVLLDVWRGEKLNRLRAMKNRDFGKCAACENRPWCKVCMMRNFNETGDLFTPAPARCEMAAMYRKIWEEK